MEIISASLQEASFLQIQSEYTWFKKVEATFSVYIFSMDLLNCTKSKWKNKNKELLCVEVQTSVVNEK